MSISEKLKLQKLYSERLLKFPTLGNFKSRSMYTISSIETLGKIQVFKMPIPIAIQFKMLLINSLTINMKLDLRCSMQARPHTSKLYETLAQNNSLLSV